VKTVAGIAAITLLTPLLTLAATSHAQPAAEPAEPPEPAVVAAAEPSAPPSAAVTTVEPSAPPAAPADASAGAPSDSAPASAIEAPPEEDPLKIELGSWWLRPSGFIRIGFESVQKDDRYDFIGATDGFILDSVRLGLGVGYDEQLSAHIALEGASDVAAGINTPQGTLDVRLKDAYFRYDPLRYIGVQIGQFSAPFAAEEIVSRRSLLFASRALGQEGVLPGRGFEEAPIALDRQVGVMLSPAKPIMFGSFGFSTYLMLANGNGANKLLPDSSRPAFIARLELMFKDWIRLGAGYVRNDRREGELPDLFDERDNGVAADLTVQLKGAQALVQFVQMMTSFPTVGSEDRTRRAISAQAGYTFCVPYLHITPAYRFAYYHPWASGGDDALDAYELQYHTAGLKLDHADLPLSLIANYTITMEKAPRELDNNRLQILAVAGF